MLETTVTLRDLIVLLLAVSGIGALAYLMLALKRLADVLSGVGRVIADNEAALRETIRPVPAITSDAAAIAGTLKKSLEEGGDSLPAILRHVEGITGSVDSGMKGVSSTVTGIAETVDTVKMGAKDVASYLEMGAAVADVATRFMSGKKSRKKKKKKFMFW